MGRQVFDANVTQLATRIPKGLHRRVKLAAIAEGVAVKDWVSAALAEYLAERGGGKPGTAGDEDAAQGRPASRVRRARRAA